MTASSGRAVAIRAIAVLVMTTLFPAAARAQDRTAPPAAGARTLQVEDRQFGQLSDKEKLKRADGAVGQMQNTLTLVLKYVGDARKDRDLIKLNCINEKLTQVKALLRLGEQSYVALQETVARGDEEGAIHEYAKIDLARRRVAELRVESEQCIGQMAYVVDERTVVTVETPEGLPDVTTNPTAAAPINYNPPALSPVQ